jgi:hypothetical protein
LLLWVFYFYFYSYYLFSLSVISTLPPSSSHSYSHPLHSPSFSCANIIALLPKNSFCPFSPTLSLCPHLPLPFSGNLSQDYPSFQHTHHLLTNLLYQLYTTSNPFNPWQAPSTTITEIHPNTHKDHKKQQTPQYFPYSSTPLTALPLVTTTYPTSTNFYR